MRYLRYFFLILCLTAVAVMLVQSSGDFLLRIFFMFFIPTCFLIGGTALFLILLNRTKGVIDSAPLAERRSFVLGLFFPFSALLGVAFCLYPFQEHTDFIFLVLLTLGLGIPLLNEYVGFSKKSGLILLFLLCFLGSLLLPPPSFFVEHDLSILWYPIAAIGWFLFIFLMRIFEKIPFMGMILFFSLFLGFFFVFSKIPDLHYVILLFVVLLLASTVYLKVSGFFLLGSSVTSYLAYIAGFFCVWIASLGGCVALPIFLAYPLMEVLIVIVLSLLSIRKQVVFGDSFLIERALRLSTTPQKVLSYVFFMNLLFVSLGALSTKQNVPLLPAYLATGIFLTDIFVRLRSSGKPQVRFKDVFSDLKEGMRVLREEMAHIPLKTENKNLKEKNEQSLHDQKKGSSSDSIDQLSSLVTKKSSVKSKKGRKRKK